MSDSVIRAGWMLALGLGVAALGGCALLSPAPPVTTFDLEAPEEVKRGHGTKGVIVVPEPTALRSLDSDRIAVKPSSTVVNYYGESQWSDRLPRLVQARAIQAFENASRLTTVGRPGDGLTPDYQLTMNIRSFELQTNPAPVAVVEITAKLISVQEGRAPAGRVFTSRVPATGDEVGDAVAALDAALADALKDLVAWATTAI